jgi:hypothetical protein
MGSTTLTIELEVEVDFEYTPGTEDVMYLPNGDPGYPGEAPELEVTRVYARTKQGKPALVDLINCLTDDDIRAIEDDIIENWEEEEPDYAH